MPDVATNARRGRSLLRVALGVLAAAAVRAETFQIGEHTFTLPEGFRIERVAGPPLVDRPITADFDELGRLYVADSAGVNTDVQEQLRTKPHRILRLEDIDGDGRFDRRTVFADRFMFPEGTLWHDGWLYVAAPPSIWRLRDVDDDGVCDVREVWFDPGTLTGCANDLHGPYLGRDGWIYWCKGAFAEQTYERPSGTPFVTRAAHIFRRHPTGSIVEPVMTGGMDNPVDVVFTPAGERIFTTTFFQHPAGGRRDGLVHAIYGGVYGKRHGVIDAHPKTGELLPVLTHLGAAAPCGLAHYDHDALGEGFRGNLFATLFNLQKVTRHVLTPDGATFTCESNDFVVSDQRDFHPTDVIVDADGSLLVVDTGGWYKLCCPTSQLHKPDVLGGIYRVRAASPGGEEADTDEATPANGAADPRGGELRWTEIGPEKLAPRLLDPRPAVRERARVALAGHGEAAVLALDALYAVAQSPASRLETLWTLCHIDADSARAASRKALEDKAHTVQQAAAHVASVWRDAGALPALQRLVEKSESLAVRRAAAEALGRLGDARAVPSLLASLISPPPGARRNWRDRIFEHSITYALLEIGDADALRKRARPDEHPVVQRACLVALDQMPGHSLKAAPVVRALASDDLALREAAWWIAGRHGDWAEELAPHFRRQILGSPEPPHRLLSRISAYASREAVSRILSGVLSGAATTPQQKRFCLEAMAAGKPETLPASWLAAIKPLLDREHPLAPEAIRTVRRWNLDDDDASELGVALRRWVDDTTVPADLRLEALAALPGKQTLDSEATLELVLDALGPSQPVARRSLATQILSESRLPEPAQRRLIDRLPDLGPLELPAVLKSIAAPATVELARHAVAKLDSASAARALSTQALGEWIEKLPPDARQSGQKLVERLAADRHAQSQVLEEKLQSLGEGDIRRGQRIFNSNETACASCHAIGYLGGQVGPDLTRIGQVRSRRDLLESLLFPSASFVRSYEPHEVITRDGTRHNGVLKEDGPDAVVLVTGPETTVRIEREEILSLEPGTTSIMPAGLDEQLSDQQLADLLAFLQATRWR